MSTPSGSRPAGWYPDPWDTGDERWFDGVAWTQRTRVPGGIEAAGPAPEMPGVPSPAASPGGSPAGAPTESPAAGRSGPPPSGPPTPDAAPATGRGPGAPVPALPAGWYADPWGSGLRWWDGAAWSAYTSGGVPIAARAPEVRLAEEREASRWTRLGLAIAGPAQAVAAIAAAFQARWIAQHWDSLTEPGAKLGNGIGNSTASAFAQLANLTLLTVGVLFLVWLYRAASFAREAGLPARRTPGLAVASFLIPIVNFWWPYQSTRDLLPPGHPGRHHVARWWALWIGTTTGGLLTFAAAFVDIALLAAVAACTAVLAILAAVTARVVVAEVLDAHLQIGAERGALA